MSALIGAGSSLLGGIFGKPKTRSARDETRGGIMGQAQGAREAAEKYGFNPLTLLASSSPMGSQTGQNYMGAAIADAGMIVAEAMAKRADAGTKSQLEAENARLKQQIQQQTLRPKTGGVYARRETIPTVGGTNASRNGSAGQNSDVLGSFQDSDLGDNPLNPVDTKAISTYEKFVNDGAGTNVPIGPEWDEIVTGWLISQNNKRKAFNANHTRGKGLRAPRKNRDQWISDLLPSGLTAPALRPYRAPQTNIFQDAKDFWLGR